MKMRKAASIIVFAAGTLMPGCKLPPRYQTFIRTIKVIKATPVKGSFENNISFINLDAATQQETTEKDPRFPQKIKTQLPLKSNEIYRVCLISQGHDYPGTIETAQKIRADGTEETFGFDAAGDACHFN